MIQRSIREATGSAFALEAPLVATVSPGQGGVLRGRGEKYFCKLAHEDQADRLEAEVDGLAALEATQSFRTPKVVCQGSGSGASWLILEWLDLHPLRNPVEAARAAEALATVHAHEGTTFGWHRDNYIGAAPQSNDGSENWARFFAQKRLLPQFERAARNGFGGDLARAGERIVRRLPALFLDRRTRPSLLHGDLWSGNLAALADGTPVLFDPACYYGDRESDLAMSELFGGLPPSFYTTYRQIVGVSEDFEARKLAYNLYHVLNHLNLFGKGYLGQAHRMIEQLNRYLG